MQTQNFTLAFLCWHVDPVFLGKTQMQRLFAYVVSKGYRVMRYLLRLRYKMFEVY